MSKQLYFKYWGKTEKSAEKEMSFHLLPFHCLDVAAVANIWWQKSRFLQRGFALQSGLAADQCLPWILFFISLHDLGKFDLRFQLKSPEVTTILQNDLVSVYDKIMLPQIKKFNHGVGGYKWFVNEAHEHGFIDFIGLDIACDWMACVAGHHGSLPTSAEADNPAFIDQKFTDLQNLFLRPAGLSPAHIPEKIPDFLAGFCSICDWIGSNSDWFALVDNPADLSSYFQSRLPIAEKALKATGILSSLKSSGGMKSVFPAFHPRGIQTLIDNFTVQQGLTIIEAPTGSGKTEAALAYAITLLAAGLADSLIFSLPSQATANAMLTRLTEVTNRTFKQGKNVILAHGKSNFNKDFLNLKRIAQLDHAQGKDEAQVQCARWLATSRKRVFLGQVGVCTVDQVLLSVLPVRHQFVRSFGVRRSILIIDEVHAYDSYMYGLLQEVLKGQVRAGGSAILLSATLPAFQKESLLQAWGSDEKQQQAEYPLVTQAILQNITHYCLPKQIKTEKFDVTLSLWPSPTLSFPNALVDKIVAKAEAGAMVGIVCNLVADAQNLAKKITSLTKIPVDLFHSRFRFCDRMKREEMILNIYGKNSKRQGRILVATQVIEQSLDLDFDWLVSQLCPIDLLFQRLGRLQRHKNIRPNNCMKRNCAVIVTAKDSFDFGDSQYVYRNIRALHRSNMLLQQNCVLSFPDVYREMIEQVYQQLPWQNEHPDLLDMYEKYTQEQDASKYSACFLAHSHSTPLPDTDGYAATLTREGEMNISIIPCLLIDGKRFCLDGAPLDDLNEFEQLEALNMESIGVAQNWRKYLPQVEKNQTCYLIMENLGNNTFRSTEKDEKLIYTFERGLEKEEQKK